MTTFTTGTRVFLFLASLYFALWSIALLLHVPAVRLAFAVVLLLMAVCVLLAACAWILRKLWFLSGKVAMVLTQKGRSPQKANRSADESEAQA